MTRLVLCLVGVAALTLSGCSSGSGGDTGGPVELRFSWWGNEQRAQATQKAIDAFEAANPGIAVKGEYADFNAYFDRIATQVAADDAPDVITMGGVYPREYGGRGALLDLAEVGGVLDLGGLDGPAVANGRFDGVQYGVPTGVNTYGIVVNPAIFEAADVPLPDDDKWTWEDFERIAGELADRAPEGAVGVEDPTAPETLEIFSKQRGEGLYTPDGEVGISTGSVEEWFRMTTRLRDAGSTPQATVTIEQAALSAPEQTLMGRGLAGMRFDWSNRLTALRTASAQPLVMLRAPGETAGGQVGMWLQASQLYTVNAATKHPEAAAKLISFLVDDPAAGAAIGTDRGIPANREIRAGLAGSLNEHQEVEVAFIEEVSGKVTDELVQGPVGSTDTSQILQRVNSDVLFDRIGPPDAARRFVDEVAAAIG
ncbi:MULTISPECIES: ABC transporter substrate-binding protein [Saccharothrix]|uniref:ABC transporter substrate-binding protein n=1 Tax=Saccharothrix TaxID=2071 RepID=UPI00093DF3F2|nr:extracellular solute-binding protein [Saccharothrix sp. CB00851]OKI18493.1 ABC transporter substrate-binding protein [Saccharothrix sp. CB00851]